MEELEAANKAEHSSLSFPVQTIEFLKSIVNSKKPHACAKNLSLNKLARLR